MRKELRAQKETEPIVRQTTAAQLELISVVGPPMIRGQARCSLSWDVFANQTDNL